MKQVAVGRTIYVAVDTFVTRFEGTDILVTQGLTTAREGHALLVGNQHLFKPLIPTYEVSCTSDDIKVEQATAAPGERRA